jgi:hypothetical protein
MNRRKREKYLWQDLRNLQHQILAMQKLEVALNTEIKSVQNENR